MRHFDTRLGLPLGGIAMGAGIDAKVALEFHLARESRPERFTSRGVNKLK
jgi:hypothetical protein